MSLAEDRHQGTFFLCLFVGILAFVAGIGAVFAVVTVSAPPWTLPMALFMPVFVAIFFATFANTQFGLCLIAFAICPLNVIQLEIAGITVRLPEVMILLLFAKEAIVFLFRRERVSPAFPLYFILPYIIAAAIGLHTGYKRGNGIVANLQDCRQFVEFITLYILIAQRVTSPRQTRQILACFIAGGTLLAIHGIIERFTNFGIPLNQLISDAVHHGGTRSGSFYGATPLGGLLVLVIGSQVALLLTGRSRWGRWLLAGSLVLCLMAIVFTYTRASWIALFLAMAFVFFSIRKSFQTVIVVGVACLLFAATLGPLVVYRMQTIEVSNKERSITERLQYYRAAWYIFETYPFRGLGWGCHYSVSDINLNKRYVPRPKYHQLVPYFTAKEDTVHSAYLQLLVKTGLIGLAAFLVFLVHFLAQTARTLIRADRDTDEYKLFIGLAGALLGYLLHSGLENFFQWAVMAQSFWLMMGLASVLATNLLKTPPLPPLKGDGTSGTFGTIGIYATKRGFGGE